MNPGPARSAGTRLWRGIALGAVFCALAVGPGCNREAFDLLNPAGIAGNAGNQALPGAGAAGEPDSFSGGGNGMEPDAGAGRGGVSGGNGGSAGFAQAGSSGNPAGCLSGEPCTPNGLIVCPPNVTFCERCTTGNDCLGNSDSPYCLASVGRCVQCRRATTTASAIPSEDCAPDEVCYPLTLRCAHACISSAQCQDDHSRPVCDSQFGACVACIKDSNCRPFNGRPAYCNFGSCVECEHSNDVATSAIDAQCPDEKPYCVGLRCQSKPR